MLDIMPFLLGLGNLELVVVFVVFTVVTYLYLLDTKLSEKMSDIRIMILSVVVVGLVFYFGKLYKDGEEEKRIQLQIDKSKELLIMAKDEYIAKRINKAIDLFEQSIALNNTDAMYELAIYYLHKGDSNKKLKAKKLLERASSLGHEEAQEILNKLNQ